MINWSLHYLGKRVLLQKTFDPFFQGKFNSPPIIHDQSLDGALARELSKPFRIPKTQDEKLDEIISELKKINKPPESQSDPLIKILLEIVKFNERIASELRKINEHLDDIENELIK